MLVTSIKRDYIALPTVDIYAIMWYNYTYNGRNWCVRSDVEAVECMECHPQLEQK